MDPYYLESCQLLPATPFIANDLRHRSLPLHRHPPVDSDCFGKKEKLCSMEEDLLGFGLRSALSVHGSNRARPSQSFSWIRCAYWSSLRLWETHEKRYWPLVRVVPSYFETMSWTQTSRKSGRQSTIEVSCYKKPLLLKHAAHIFCHFHLPLPRSDAATGYCKKCSGTKTWNLGLSLHKRGLSTASFGWLCHLVLACLASAVIPIMIFHPKDILRASALQDGQNIWTSNQHGSGLGAIQLASGTNACMAPCTDQTRSVSHRPFARMFLTRTNKTWCSMVPHFACTVALLASELGQKHIDPGPLLTRQRQFLFFLMGMLLKNVLNKLPFRQLSSGVRTISFFDCIMHGLCCFTANGLEARNGWNIQTVWMNVTLVISFSLLRPVVGRWY